MTETSPTLRSVALADAQVLSALHVDGPDGAWSADAYARLLVLPGTFGQLATAPSPEGPVPVGFVLARAVADEAEILNINVAREWRGRGVGRALLEAVMASARDARRMLLEVAEGNAPAISLYHACGFRPVGRRIGYYARPGGSREDALILAISLDEAARKMYAVQPTVKLPKG
jgi:[ribosomal protein S18]-alanine N-acetyltransferase